MKLRVRIECVDCGQTTEVHVLGPWDLNKVLHECAKGRGHVPFMHSAFEKGPIHVRFKPPRRPF